jgi:hypothetical protein
VRQARHEGHEVAQRLGVVEQLAQFHADHLDGLGPGLGHRNNTIVGFQFAAEIGRTSRHDLFHIAVVIFDAQQGADSDQLELHLDAEIFEGFG